MKNSERTLQKEANKIAVFEDKKIRRVFHKDEWYFSIIDIVEVLTNSANSRRYWSDLKTQLAGKEGFIQLYGKIVQLKLLASGGKMRRLTQQILKLFSALYSLFLLLKPSLLKDGLLR